MGGIPRDAHLPLGTSCLSPAAPASGQSLVYAVCRCVRTPAAGGGPVPPTAPWEGHVPGSITTLSSRAQPCPPAKGRAGQTYL